MDGPFDFSGPSEERLKAVEDLYKKQMHNFIHGLFDKEEMLQNAVMAMAMIQVNKIFDYEIDDAVKPEFIDTLAERVKEMTKNPVQLTALLTCIKVGSMAMILEIERAGGIGAVIGITPEEQEKIYNSPQFQAFKDKFMSKVNEQLDKQQDDSPSDWIEEFKKKHSRH